jgi:hypothetical protein
MADPKAGGALDPIDRDRDIQLLGLDIARRNRRLVGGRTQQQAGFRLK